MYLDEEIFSDIDRAVIEHERNEALLEEERVTVNAWAVVLCLLAAVVMLLIFAVKAQAEVYESDVAVADAIFRAEGGVKAAPYYYGVRSIPCKDISACQRICLNSVRNARKRWEAAGRPENFIVFMGRRYSPPDKNPNWVRLVKYFLKNK